MTPIPLRVRAWGWFMDRFDSMHIATMSPTDIAHNQTMQHVPAPLRRLLFGARDRRVAVDDRTLPPAPGSTTGIPIRIYRPRLAPSPRTSRAGATTPNPGIGAGTGTGTGTDTATSTTPSGSLPIALYLHGGGWTLFGALDMCDWLPSRVAAELGAIVVAVDYRLAPQHPFPAAVDDCQAALDWVSANATALGADPARLAVFGDSAGGNLAAVLSLLARDDADSAAAATATSTSTPPPPEATRGLSPGAAAPRIAAQALIYPVTDTVLDDASMRANAHSPVLHQADMAAFFDYYLGPDATSAARVDARAAPARASTFANLPPALVQLGAHDVLHDQGLSYARQLGADGTEVTVITYPEAPHGWVTYPGILRVATRAADDLVEFLRRHLG
ncbi:alpha/beta hydrolase [Subtercola endophyticus]|uniref:alpha/beta hydrolase n=1 Tax=Subtercola endophyticus TaxID=2895559 RepID=UPI001E2BB625|nr:alpha/beta hydrolase [Subtercola endophyticus]UFS59099.1 alpha/beta hydrolase [Subtercola endophyticus]